MGERFFSSLMCQPNMPAMASQEGQVMLGSSQDNRASCDPFGWPIWASIGIHKNDTKAGNNILSGSIVVNLMVIWQE